MASLQRSGFGARRRIALTVALTTMVLLLSGCTAEVRHEWRNFALPDPATEEAQGIFDLWTWGWVAALVTGVIVWGLIFWVVFRYRQKSPDEIPVQTRYNLPLEIFYTIAPILMVIVFFYWTVKVQNDVLAEPDPQHTIVVVGSKWSWTFNYTDEDAVDSPNVYTSGTGSDIPELWLPVDEVVLFELRSPDVIHSFWIPGFLMKMDVVPGRDNQFQVTPNTVGEFRGKCAELCGTYHSRMLFNVKVVPLAEYEAHLRDLEAIGNASDAPVVGGEFGTLEVGTELPSQRTGVDQ